MSLKRDRVRIRIEWVRMASKGGAAIIIEIQSTETRHQLP